MGMLAGVLSLSPSLQCPFALMFLACSFFSISLSPFASLPCAPWLDVTVEVEGIHFLEYNLNSNDWTNRAVYFSDGCVFWSCQITWQSVSDHLKRTPLEFNERETNRLPLRYWFWCILWPSAYRFAFALNSTSFCILDFLRFHHASCRFSHLAFSSWSSLSHWWKMKVCLCVCFLGTVVNRHSLLNKHSNIYLKTFFLFISASLSLYQYVFFSSLPITLLKTLNPLWVFVFLYEWPNFGEFEWG